MLLMLKAEFCKKIKHVFQLLKFLVAISCSYEVMGAGQAESLALFKLFKITVAI